MNCNFSHPCGEVIEGGTFLGYRDRQITLESPPAGEGKAVVGQPLNRVSILERNEVISAKNFNSKILLSRRGFYIDMIAVSAVA